MSRDIANTRRGNWDVNWNGVDLGYVDAVNPDLKLMLDAIQVGTLGKMKVGDRFTGLEGTITVQVRELTRTLLATLTPWFSGTAASAEIPLAPANNVDLYAHAQALLLHPTDQGAVVNQDVEIYKAVCVTLPSSIPRDGSKDDVWSVVFNIYPDRTKLAAGTQPWGRVKPTPP